MTYYTYFTSVWEYKEEICSSDIEDALDRVDPLINLYDEIDENVLLLVQEEMLDEL